MDTNTTKEYTNENGDVKEGFCGACVAVPLAMIGAGASAYGSGNGSHDQTKTIVFWAGVATVIISTLVAIYFLFIKDCKDCKI